jgi:hypothetical protein
LARGLSRPPPPHTGIIEENIHELKDAAGDKIIIKKKIDIDLFQQYKTLRQTSQRKDLACGVFCNKSKIIV